MRSFFFTRHKKITQILITAGIGYLAYAQALSVSPDNALNPSETDSEEELYSMVGVHGYDDTEDTEEDTETYIDDGRYVITSFSLFDIASNYVYANADNRPTLEELLSYMPQTLYVVIDGINDIIEIPVTWESEDEDYSESEQFYFQFSPVINEEKFRFASEEVQNSAPYIGVFLGNYVTGNGQTNGLSGTVNVSADKQAIFNFLITEGGFNRAAACGIMANISAECDFRSNLMEGKYARQMGYTSDSYTTAVDNGTYTNFVHDHVGYGLTQWTYWEHKQNLLNYAKKKQVSISNMYMQLEFMMIELKEMKFLDYLRNVPDTAQGAYDAAYYFCTKYERPKNYLRSGVVRGNLAMNYFGPTFANGEATACDHNYTDFVLQAADCQHTGEIKTVCDYCGDYFISQVPKDANVHTNTEIRNAVAATATTEGFTGDTYCKDCGKLVEQGQVIPKLGDQTAAGGTESTESTESTENGGTGTGGAGSTETGGTGSGSTETGTGSGGAGSGGTETGTGSGGTETGGTGSGSTETGSTGSGSTETGTGSGGSGSGTGETGSGSGETGSGSTGTGGTGSGESGSGTGATNTLESGNGSVTNESSN